MASQNFIPEIWASSILTNFHNQTVLTQLANRQYEGDLTSGSKLHIPGIVDVKVKDYKANKRTTTPDEVGDTGIELLVDQEKNFDFYVDDIDRAQASYSFESYTSSASTGLVEDAETYLSSLLLTSGTPATDITTPTNGDTAYNAVLDLRQALTSAKTPVTQRVLIINAKFERFLLAADSKLAAADTSASTAGIREATIGRLQGFDVITSPWLEDTTATAVALWTPALAFVSQVQKVEGMRGEKKFADRVRGLHVYGAKVTRSSAVQVFRAGAPTPPKP